MNTVNTAVAVHDMLALDSILNDLASLIRLTLHIDFDQCALCNAEAFAVHADILTAVHAQL